MYIYIVIYYMYNNSFILPNSFSLALVFYELYFISKFINLYKFFHSIAVTSDQMSQYIKVHYITILQYDTIEYLMVKYTTIYDTVLYRFVPCIRSKISSSSSGP